jgi:DNA sulfur modification protein DndB
MKLGAIPKMFTFRDWVEFQPEDREQRILNKKRVPDIAGYIVDNEDGYIFSSITASYKCKVRFLPLTPDGVIGTLEMDFEDANFVINDGQHRCAAIAHALKLNPALSEETISVLLFPYESLSRVQQMFSDLNRCVVKTSKSLDILYDKRDTMSAVTLEVCQKVPVFDEQVDKDAVSLPVRSPKLFSLASLYDATCELLKDYADTPHHELVTMATEYWIAVSKAIPSWGRVKSGELKAMELRQSTISSHSVVLRAIGGIGAELLKEFSNDWKGKLLDLGTVNWSKSNHEWDNICMVAGSVVSNRQARLATKAYLKRHMGLSLSDSEKRSLPTLVDQAATLGGYKPDSDSGPRPVKPSGPVGMPVPSQGAEPDYIRTFREQLKTPYSLVSRMRRYIEEVGSLSIDDLRKACVQQLGCKSETSGSIAASVRVLELDGYVRTTGRGESKRIFSTRSSR